MAARMLFSVLKQNPYFEKLYYPLPLVRLDNPLLLARLDNMMYCRNNIFKYSSSCSRLLSFGKHFPNGVVSHRKYLCTTEAESNLSINKKLIILMEKWEVEKAVKLVKKAIAMGDVPYRSVVLNFLQLLANLGEYECLLDLHELLTAENLITDKKFYMCLHEAYYNSGRVEEGVAVLRILYHKTRKYDDIDIFFVLIAVMILKHFPHRSYLIENFVKECEEMKDSLPAAGLWKSYMLTCNFEKADELISTNQNILTHLSHMAHDLMQLKHSVDTDVKTVLYKLCNVPYLKDKSRAAVYLAYMSILFKDHCWTEMLRILDEAGQLGVSFPEKELNRLCDSIIDFQITNDNGTENDLTTECLVRLKILEKSSKK